MELSKAEIQAKQLIKYYHLDFSFTFDNAKSRNGQCNYTRKLISLSRDYVLLNEESKVINTILHEIAHALVGFSHHHDSTWKETAINIGCSGERCSSETISSIPNMTGICPNCKSEFHRYRKVYGFCTKCFKLYSKEFYINWV